MPTANRSLSAIRAGQKLSAASLRGTSTQRGYGYRWQKLREAYLSDHPLCCCVDCAKLLMPLPANVVDHKIPHKGNMELFWDQGNWQPMNSICHNKKTARDDGGFGNNGWTIPRNN